MDKYASHQQPPDSPHPGWELFEQITESICLLDENLKVAEANAGFTAMLGYTRDEIMQLHAWDWSVAQPTRESMLAAWPLLHSEHSLLERQWRRKDGSIVEVQISDSEIDWFGQRLTLSLSRDITRKKRLEKLLDNERHILERLASGEPLTSFLQQLAQHYEALFDGIQVSLLLLQPDGVHLSNGAAPSLPASYCQAIEGLAIGPTIGSCGTAAYTGQKVLVDDIATHPYWANFRTLALAHNLHACWSIPVLSIENKVLGTFAIYSNRPRSVHPDELSAFERGAYIASLAIERARAEESRETLAQQLRVSQKMEAIGTLAGGIAHDFNNIITAILGNLDLALKATQDVNATTHHTALPISLEEIRKAGHRARKLVQQILAFSRRQQLERQIVALPSLVEDTLQLLRVGLPPGIQLDAIYPVHPVYTLADPTQIEQVLLNLGTNALYAMHERTGTIRYTLSTLQLETPHAFQLDSKAASAIATSLTTPANLPAGDYALLVVQDEGHGMDDATLHRIFEPFFTTKPTGQGTGLGLSVAYGIMLSHGGTITVNSTPGQGTRFQLYLPLSKPPEQRVSLPTPPHQEIMGCGQLILIIDDDEAILYLISRMLRQRGYHTQCFTKQQEALQCFSSAPKDFSLIITDYNLPGMSGLEIAQAIRSLHADIPILMISGYIPDRLREQAPLCGVTELVSKPDSINDLCTIIQRHVQNRPQPLPMAAAQPVTTSSPE